MNNEVKDIQFNKVMHRASEFTILQKKRIKLLLLLIMTLGQASIALYLPSFPEIAHDLSISPTDVKQTITAFLIGFGVSPVFYGPISDRYGRKPIILISIFLACLGYIINLFAMTLNLFLFARLLQGLGCGGILVGGRAIARDVFSGRELASASSYLSMGFAIGFGVTPVIGGLISHSIGWQANFMFLLLVGICIFISIFRYLPETMINKDNKKSLNNFLQHTFSDYWFILNNRNFLKMLFGGLFAYGVVMSYNVMTPFLMQYAFNLSAQDYGYMAILMGIPYYLAASYNRKLVMQYGITPVFILGYCLIISGGVIMFISGILLSQSLFMVVISMMIAVFGQAFIFSNTISGALQEFSPESGGKASAMFSSLQMVLASLLSAIMAILPNRTQLSLSEVIVALGILSAIILIKRG